MKKWLMSVVLEKMIYSRKFIYTCIGLLTTLLSEKLNLNPEEVNNILMSIAALVLGQGFADMNKKK